MGAWTDLLPVVVTTVGLYATTFVLVRLGGRRTVSQLSAFDALITVALGSTLATSILSDPPAYGRGAAAIVTLLAVQLVVEYFRQRLPRVRRLLDFPTKSVLDERGLHLDRSLTGAQLTPEEIEAAIRAAGYTDAQQVAMVVFEGNGRFSVIPHRGPDR